MSVMIVDDDPFVSESLKIILDNESDIEVKAVANSGEEAVKLAPSVNPDVIVMDIRMEGMNGTDAAEKIIGNGSASAILFLTTFLDDEYINKALKIGAKGYIIKQDCGSLPSSVRAVASGQAVFGGKVVEKLPDLLNRKERFDPSEFDITAKELEIIKLIADGMSNKEIAEKVFLGEGTVRNMVSSILDKLDLRDRT
ncbi:MAG: response regulator transcription factor, partial [Clostridiales bacterium]|nr:response regulator transcription factor [Clostridiales bacterium]